jgi:hypothetical protein
VSEPYNVGIDVSIDRLDVAIRPGGRAFCVTNDAADWAELLARLPRGAIAAIGLEPSGGYERGIVRVLLAAGFSVRRINPNKLRQFARAAGALAKNDRIDARLIADYITVMPTRVVERNPAIERLAETVTMRRQLCDEQITVESQASHLEDALLQRIAKRRLTRIKADSSRQPTTAIIPAAPATLRTGPLWPSSTVAAVVGRDKSHTRAVLSWDPVTTRFPSGLNATLLISSRWPSSGVAAGVAPDKSHTRAVWSEDPATTRIPSGLNATLQIPALWPLSGVAAVVGRDKSHTRAVLSWDPVTTRFPSGLNATLLTPPPWPFSRVGARVSSDKSHTRAIPSEDPVITCFPSELNATLQTSP